MYIRLKIMRYHKNIVGEKCYLSPIAVDETKKWVERFNGLEITIPIGDEVYSQTKEHKEREAIIEIFQNDPHLFTIVDLKSDELIGYCMLFGVDSVDKHARLGIVINEKSYWNKGYGKDAIILLLRYGFNVLELETIMLGIFSHNKSSIKSFKKAGFQEVGYKREIHTITGKKYSMTFMDIIADEFKSVYVHKLLE